jgi:3-oxoacyl-[acyl-carrier protein] reductase
MIDHSSPPPARVALVTGAGRNIGRAIAIALADDGVAVVVNARSSEREAQAVVDEINSDGGEALMCLADITDRDAVDAMIDQVRQTYGRLDILVNNAAIRQESAFEEMTYADWRQTLDLCLDGAFHCTQAALPLLKLSGGGSIINIGGLTAHTGASQRVHVVTAKAGLVGMTRALAHELAPHGITVNCVAPGLIETKRGATSTPAPHHHAQRTNLLGRRGQPEEIAEAVRWLAGPGARYVTGQVMHLNGGAYLGG